ncbi:hypothetical protein GQ54DRAFT_246064, partial [Martensiomyces pterosporus]
DGSSTPVLRSAIQRYSDIINREHFTAPVNYKQGVLRTSGTFRGLKVAVSSATDDLQFGVDESYELSIPVDGEATLTAKTPYGALHGLETFSQLVSANGQGRAIQNTPIHIRDAPAFPHRGILFDTARNYFPVRAILRTLDAMSYNKMNVFHWHIVDSHSWPIQSKTHPELQAKGSYGPEWQYSYQDVQRVIQHAKERGIRVIPEFDVPGHTMAIGYSHPELMSCMNVLPDWTPYAADPGSGQLNIAKNESIALTKDIVGEYAQLFPDHFFHLGGDEVNRNCWKDDAYVQEYLKQHPREDIESLLARFYSEVHGHLQKQGKAAFSWEETLFHSTYTPPKDTVIQTWIDETSIPKAVARGYRSIASPSNAYYLDCGEGGWYSNSDDDSWCDPFKTWMHIYNFDPLANVTDVEQQKLVLGGEVCVWTPQTDEHRVDPKIWPRACALAETAWSGKKDANGRVRTTGEVASRLHEQRFRMVGRGINAEPMQPLWCARNPGACNL